MYKITIRSGLFVLIAVMLLTVSGCAYSKNCERWDYRTSYRQVCKRWSGTHCAFWGSEAYQEKYCAQWKSKEQIEYEKKVEKTAGTAIITGDHQERTDYWAKFIRTPGESQFPKNSDTPTDGETYLLTQLTPFLCEIEKSDDIVETLASMGQVNITGQRKSGVDFKFSTKNFYGITFGYDKIKMRLHLFIYANEKSWPFTEDEVVDWMSSIGLGVYKTTGNNPSINGVTEMYASDHWHNMELSVDSRPQGRGISLSYDYLYQPRHHKTVFCNEKAKK